MSKAHSQRAHAKLSPSSAKRWFSCPGSIRLSADTSDKSSVYADEGTAAHTLAEKCLRGGWDATDFLGGHVNIKTGQVERYEAEGDGIFTIDEEMVDAVDLYISTVRSLKIKGDEFEYEAKLDLRHIPGMEFGTGDFVRYRENTKELVIVDFKYGRGVPVDVEENEQLFTYAVGTARRFHNRGLAKVLLMVVQPRCPHPAGPVRMKMYDALDLVEFRFRLVDAAEATMADDAPLVPGEWCRFCPAAPTCEALRGHSLAVAEMEFADEPPTVGDLDAEQLSAILAKASVVEGWIKRVQERAHQMAIDGNPPPGFKLVHSTSHRKWKDEDEIATLLRHKLELTEEQMYTAPKLKSPAAMEKVLGAKRRGELVGYVHKPPGKLILVPESDPRAPAKPGAEEEFA